jgi:hypothetical protein
MQHFETSQSTDTDASHRRISLVAAIQKYHHRIRRLNRAQKAYHVHCTLFHLHLHLLPALGLNYSSKPRQLRISFTAAKLKQTPTPQPKPDQMMSLVFYLPLHMTANSTLSSRPMSVPPTPKTLYLNPFVMPALSHLSYKPFAHLS